MNEKWNEAQTVFAAVDGSATARTAATVAVQLAHGLGWPLTALYVVDEALIFDTYRSPSAEIETAVTALSRAALTQSLEAQGGAVLQEVRAAALAADVPVRAELVFGGLPDLLLQRAADAGLLALGRRGRGNDGNGRGLGRHFTAVAHHTAVPLLVGGDTAPPLRRLLLAYDGSERARRVLVWAAQLQRALHAQLFVLHAHQDEAESAAAMSQTLHERGLETFDLLWVQGRPSAAIVQQAAEHDVDLILMGSYSHNAFLEWLLGSTVERVLQQTPLPVLLA